jgi:serine/threonine-protein kinase
MSDPGQHAPAPPAAAAQPSTVAAPPAAGPYTDLTPHARGGLGEVLRATDPELHRTVAVKRLLDGRADDLDSRRRFLQEAEVTARLEHPGVVPVYGLFHDGSRPCYAMRFVEGQTLAAAIMAYHAGPPNPLAFRRLLQSFLQVCQTVAYAHSRGVLHRDLKPANIMLGRFGETLVVDWGLAKTVGRTDEVRAGSPDATLQPRSGSGVETELGAAVGTPAYMSPEQAAGRWDVVGLASDVYGLGAVLYTLLTGRPPLERGNWPQMQQRIQRGDFPRPQQVRPGVPPALEAVCLKAMALEPGDRYPSAEALAADLEHWLADEPLAAYPDPLATRARRWGRRHRTLVSAAVVLLVAGLAATLVGLVLLGRKNEEIAAKNAEVTAERNAAREAAAEAQAINAFLTEDLLGQADPDVNDRERKATVEEVLHKAARQIAGNPKFAGRPEVEATLRLTIGRTFFRLGNLPEAEQHLRRAMELRREALGADDPRTLAAQDLFTEFLNLGPQRPAEAEPLARQTWEARGRVLGPEDPDTIDSLDTYATSLYLSGRVPEAITRFRECLSARRRVLGSDHPDTATSMNNLGAVLYEQGQWAEAIPLLREGLDVHSRQRQGKEYGITVYNLATALYLKGDLKEADRLLQENRDRSAKQFGADHTLTNRTRGLLVRVWTDQGRVQDAVSLGREVVASWRRTSPNHARTGNTLLDLGRGLVSLGLHSEAERTLAEARRIYAQAPPHPRDFIAWAECWHGASLAGLRRFDEAEPLLVDAERKLREAPGTPRRHYLQAVEQVVKFYEAWGKPEKAREWKAKLDQAAK